MFGGSPSTVALELLLLHSWLHHAGLLHLLHTWLLHLLHAWLHHWLLAVLLHGLSRLLHHLWLLLHLHAWLLHHTWLLHAGLLHHSWLLHHAGLLHAGLLHHAWLLHHTWLLALHICHLILLLCDHLLLLHHLLLHHLLLGHHLLLVDNHSGLLHLARSHLILRLTIAWHAVASWDSEALKLTSDRSFSSFGATRSPGALKVDGTGLFASVLNGEPLVDSGAYTQGGQLDRGFADQVAGGYIFIEDLDCHVITDILDVELESLLPARGLTSTLESTSSELLHTTLKDAVRVHLTEELSISCKLGLDHVDRKHSGSCHSKLSFKLKIYIRLICLTINQRYCIRILI